MQDNSTKLNMEKTFDWFDSTVTSKVKEQLCLFFESAFDVSLISLNLFETIKEDIFMKGDMFYSCTFPIKNKQHIILRLSSDFIRMTFHDIFGSTSGVFDLEKLTELEIRILNTFFEDLSKDLIKMLIEDSSSEINPLIKENVNLAFSIKNKDVQTGKIGITIPLNRLNPKEIELNYNFVFADFLENSAITDIKAGSSRISLSDLKQLEKDDIIVLENSSIKTMTLISDKMIKPFGVNPEPSIMIEGEEEEEEEIENNKGNIMSENKNMWDDIQIEVSAEFKKVKMTLGDLRQISKGLVVDLGSVIKNEISLLVENKTVAKGELVIINDKYGVKITEVTASSNKKEESEQNEPKPEVQKTIPPKQPQAAAGAPKQAVVPPRPQHKAGAPIPKPKMPAPNQNKDLDYSKFEE